ncbi:hypothetical protein ACO0SA_000228 [Hanseniaspora valbyensis]
MKFTTYLTSVVAFANIVSSLPISVGPSLTKRSSNEDSDDIEYVTEYITKTFVNQPTKVVTVLDTAVITTSVTVMPTSTFAAKML